MVCNGKQNKDEILDNDWHRKKVYIYVGDPKIKVKDNNHCVIKQDIRFYDRVLWSRMGGTSCKEVILAR